MAAVASTAATGHPQKDVRGNPVTASIPLELATHSNIRGPELTAPTQPVVSDPKARGRPNCGAADVKSHQPALPAPRAQPAGGQVARPSTALRILGPFRRQKPTKCAYGNGLRPSSLRQPLCTPLTSACTT